MFLSSPTPNTIVYLWKHSVRPLLPPSFLNMGCIWLCLTSIGHAESETTSDPQDSQPSLIEIMDTHIEEVATIAPAQEMRMIRRARIAFDDGNFDRSVELFDEVYTAHPILSNGLNLARSLYFVGQSNRADTLFRELLIEYPIHRQEIKGVWAEMLMTQNRAQETLDTLNLKSGHRHKYDSIQSQYFLEALYQLQRWDELESTLRTIRSQTPLTTDESTLIEGLTPDLFLLEAMMHVEQQEFNIAEQKLSLLVIDYPENIQFRLLLADLYGNMNNIEQQEQILTELQYELESRPEVILASSSHSRQIGERETWKEEGLSAIQLLYSQRTDDFWAEVSRHHHLAESYWNLGDLNNAAYELELVLQMHPNDEEAHRLLGIIRIEQRDFVQAENALEQTKEKQPESPNVDEIEQQIEDAIQLGVLLLDTHYWLEPAVPWVLPFDSNLEESILDPRTQGLALPKNLYTTLGLSHRTLRPDAFILLREDSYSDGPPVGYRIQQSTYSQHLDLRLAEHTAFGMTYTRQVYSGSIDQTRDIISHQYTTRYALEQGVLHVIPQTQMYFDGHTASQTALWLPTGKMTLLFQEADSNRSFGLQGFYGKQRISKVDGPNTLRGLNLSASQTSPTDIAYTNLGLRRNIMPDGSEYRSVISKTGWTTTYEEYLPSIELKIERNTGLPKGDSAWGVGLDLGVAYQYNDVLPVPYATFSHSRMAKYKYYDSNQFDLGLQFDHAFRFNKSPIQSPTDAEIPHRVNVSFQRVWYPNNPLPASGTLFLQWELR